MVVLLVCGLLIFFNPKGIFDPFRGIFFKLSYPFQKASYIASSNIAETFSFFSSIGSMREENKKLIKENSVLISEVVSLKDMKKENEVFREQLRLAPKERFDLEAAFIIGQDPQGLGSWLLIDKGSDKGLKVGMPVIVSDGILVGRLEEVRSDSSKVTLLTDSASAVNAENLETDAKGLVRGNFGLGLVFDMVAQSDILNKGDSVITSGLGGVFPKGLLIGKIEEVKESPDRLFQQAIISPMARYHDLEVVFVIK